MKVQELLDIQEAITKRGTPSDMRDEELNQHYSTSKDEHIDLLDMDIVHLVRSYSKCLDMGKVSDTNLLVEKLDSVSRIVASAKDLLVDKS